MRISKYIPAVAMALIMGLTSCGNSDEGVAATTPKAVEQGLNDAKELLKIPATDVRYLHSALLAVKAREWEMRRKGDEASADAYINSFKDYVAGHDKALADEIF